MILNDSIFRAYDIRGEAFVDFDDDGMFVLAQGFGQYLREKLDTDDGNPKLRVLVTGDGRQSQSEFAPALEAGLEAAGCDVVWGGTVPTPVNFFAFRDRNFDGAIQLSASHNPACDNGLKLTDREGAVCGEEIQKIKEICHFLTPTKREGITEREDMEECILNDYAKKIKTSVSEQKALKLVIDAGNGISGMVYPQIYRSLGHSVDELFCDLNTTFPNHQPDPERSENLRDLVQRVKEIRADFGIAFDGDGDRAGIVLSDGTILNADKILFILAADFLSRNPGEVIIVDAMSSATLAEKIRSIGGRVIRSKTGHSFIEEAMHEHNSLLGGEQSGHFMLGENFYGHDDACLAGLRFLSAVEKFPALLLEVTTRWPNLLEFSEKFFAADDKKFSVLEKITEQLLRQFPTADTTDGVRIDWADGEWAIIRCSNTSPKISVRIEARDEVSLNEKKELFVGMLEKLLKQKK
jgi:phosphomannomutase/phosphoglucomutase